jgi:hypothetical protein
MDIWERVDSLGIPERPSRELVQQLERILQRLTGIVATAKSGGVDE